MLAGEFEKAADGGGIMPAACVEDERVREARLPCGLEAREDGGAPAARRLTADESEASSTRRTGVPVESRRLTTSSTVAGWL